MRRLPGALMVVAAVKTAATAALVGQCPRKSVSESSSSPALVPSESPAFGGIRKSRIAPFNGEIGGQGGRTILYQSLFSTHAGSGLLRVLTSLGGIARRFLGAFMLVTVVLTVAATTLTTVLAGSAQAASGLGPARFGIRLVDVPVDEANNPRAFRYIIDHLNPGTTIHRRVQIANLGASAARITVYPDAAVIRGGYFIGDVGETPSELTTWITVSRPSVSLAPNARAMVTVTIRVPRTASPGNLYGVIWAQETGLGKTGYGINVLEVNRVGIRIYLSVGPGGPPPVNFDITSITATRSASGQMQVLAQVHNTGGQAIDASGYLKLTDGPGGLSAGPYQETGVTLAPGQSEPIKVVLDKQLPNGPWRALIELTSGITQRSAVATIDFSPAAGANYLIIAVILLIVLVLLAGLAVWLIRRNRRSSPTTGHSDLVPAQPGR
jgi:hypothetical protein